MRRITSLSICAIAVAALLAATAVADPGPIVSPTADPYYKYGGLKNTKGFGTARPREIFYGGDPTGLVCNFAGRLGAGRPRRATGPAGTSTATRASLKDTPQSPSSKPLTSGAGMASALT